MIDHLEEDDKQQKPKRRGNGTPVLDNFSKDLLKLAEEGKLDSAIGREKEIQRIARILARRKKNNPIIIGEAGCGKTNLIEGLAILIQKGDCPKSLQNKRILSLDLNSIVAGTKYRGQFEERMKVIIEELKLNPNIIIFIDEIHTLIGSGNASGGMDSANIFKPSLASGEIQCIGATTFDEYRKSIEKDKALDRRFQPVQLTPSSVSETIEILKNSKIKYETHHKVSYSDELIVAIVKLAERYLPNRVFPDKAFDVLDEIGAKLQTDIRLPENIEKLRQEAANILAQKRELVKSQEYEKAAELRDIESKILKQLKDEKNKFEEELTKDKKVATFDDLYEVISSLSGVPVKSLNYDDKDALKNLNLILKTNIVGQDEALDKISRSIKRFKTGIKDPNKPNSYILLGNTGVGKTYLAKQLAKHVFGSEENMIRIDMSEYQERFNISRLVGSPPGYVSHEDGGELTEKVRKKPYCVVLLDEIEKAHRDIFSLFLQILDDGHLTDAAGRKVNFKNALILFSSNIGVRKFRDFGTGIGFTKNKNNESEEMKNILLKELKKNFSPEFLNRIDDIVLFNALSKENLVKICEIECEKMIKRLEDMGFFISFEKNVYEHIVEIGYDEENGARPIKRSIDENLGDFISDKMLDNEILENQKYIIFVDNNDFKIKDDI